LKATTKKTGRPRKEVNFNLVDQLWKIQCTGEEIASVLDMDYDTLNARVKENFGIPFSDYFKRKSGAGKASLRRTQFELAKKSAAMCIWLGKQYLNQREPETYIPEEPSEMPEFENMSNDELEKYIDKHRN
jgi:hypothetical protein